MTDPLRELIERARRTPQYRKHYPAQWRDIDALADALESSEAKLKVAREALDKIYLEAGDLLETVDDKHVQPCDSFGVCDFCHADGHGTLISKWSREALSCLETP